MRSWSFATGLVCLASAITAGAVLWSAPAPEASPPRSEGALRTGKEAKPAPLPPVTTLHEQATSAYHARLFADEEGVVLITQAGFTVLGAGRAPEEHALALGPVAVRQGSTIVFWRSGKLRSVSLSGDDERELVLLARAPQHLLASAGRLAWIQTDGQTGTSLEALSSGQVRAVHASQDIVSAATLHGDMVYWVAEARSGGWRIGGVGLDGQPFRATRVHPGRPPAMLAVGADGVYFYSGLERGVRRLSFDLDRETAVLARVICSPLSVSSRVVCAHVGGLFDIAPAARAPRFLAAERAGPVTATAVTDGRAYWVAEGGEERLLVRSIELPSL